MMLVGRRPAESRDAMITPVPQRDVMMPVRRGTTESRRRRGAWFARQVAR